MKQEFIEFLNALIAAAPEVAEKMMTDNVKNYIEALTSNTEVEKPVLATTSAIGSF